MAETREQQRVMAEGAMKIGATVHTWGEQPDAVRFLARALENLAKAFIFSTCVGEDPCGVCAGCTAQEALKAADIEAHRGVA